MLQRGERAIAVTSIVILVAAGSLAVGRSGSAIGDSPFPDPLPVPEDLAVPAAVPQDDLQGALDDAGCRLLVDGQALQDRRHLDPDAPPPAVTLYGDVRPAHSGRHLPTLLELPDRIAPEPIDERVVLHNMEHGSVVVWFDVEQVDGAQVTDVQAWMRERRSQGFESRAAGGIFTSPSPDISSGLAVAYRAWGHAVDCERFDRTVADAFLGDHWGSRGDAPEASLSPFPVGVMGEVGDAV